MENKDNYTPQEAAEIAKILYKIGRTKELIEHLDSYSVGECSISPREKQIENLKGKIPKNLVNLLEDIL